MSAGARKRTAAGAAKRSAAEGKLAKADTRIQPTSALPSSKEERSVTRIVLKALFGVVCIVCLIFAALPYLQSDPNSVDDIVQRAPDSKQHWEQPNSAYSAQTPQSSVARNRTTAAEAALARSMRYLETNLPFEIPERMLTKKVIREADTARRDAVKEAFDASWAAYVEDAFGADDYHPISRQGSNFSTDGGVGYFIIDVIDMLLIMNEKREYERVRDWVRALSWDDKRGKFSVFETTIRTLGGLLSAHALCTPTYSTLSQRTSQLCAPGDADMFLEKAVLLAECLRPAFEVNALGLPEREVDFATERVFADVDNQGMISLAEAATIQLEFKFLAHVTGEVKWWYLAERPIAVVREASQRSRSDGLLPIFLNPQTGQPVPSEIRLGSRGDSYYEYLIKQYVQTNRSETVYLEMYQRAQAGIKMHLLKQSPKRRMLHTAEILPRFDPRTRRQALLLIPKQDHLVCFLGGSMMLGALHVQQSKPLRSLTSLAYPLAPREARSNLTREDWSIGHELIRTCVATYTETKTGLSPEIAMFRLRGDSYPGPETDWYIKKPKPNPQLKNAKKPAKAPEPLIDARNILRPETVESLFIAFHLTGDEQYRTWGWRIFQAFVDATRLRPDGAFASIRDVNVDAADVQREDRMETFWLAETLKYLYLLFADQDTLRLDEWVLNTEAHPLPIFTPTFDTGVV